MTQIDVAAVGLVENGNGAVEGTMDSIDDINRLLGKLEAERGALEARKRALQARDMDCPAVERARLWGHRAFVGGDTAEAWYGIGKRQYHFLISRGLRPEHKFLDIACGALRLGQFLIPMLDSGNYFGLEGEPYLVQQGLESEMLFDVVAAKSPNFAHNYVFDFSFCPRFHFAMAQSLFTHLTEEDIALCFRNLLPHAAPGAKFFFTFFEGDKTDNPTGASHANKGWKYDVGTLRALAGRFGWRFDYIGDWGHERGQMMALVERT